MVLYGVIMAGGYGTRFWPYSRSNKPKQLLKIFSDKSLMQETVDRLSPLIPDENIFISTNEFLGNLIKEELPNVNFVIEPMQRDTAACIGLSAITLYDKDPEAVMFIETSDHIYKDIDAYINTIRKAVITATNGKIVLIGIEPSVPHTGYGYIHVGEEFEEDVPDTFFVQAFKEKPDLKTAKEYVESKEYVWNSGMFIAKCSVMLEEIEKNMPELHSGLMKIKESNFDKKVMEEVFEGLEKISIDYGVMERSDNIVVIRSSMPWDDLGDFIALERSYPSDDKRNISIGKYEGNVTKCIMLSQTRKIIANNVRDLVIADTPDATLICQKSDMQLIKKMIEKIKEADLSEYLENYVTNYSKNIISHESGECDVDTDGLIVLSGVSNLEIKRTDNELIIEGIENEVD